MTAVRLVGLAGAGDYALEVAGERHFGDVVEHHPGAELLGLLLQSVHQFRALDAAREAGEVLHLRGVHQGTSRADGPGDDERLEPGAGGVDRRGVAGRAGSDDDQLFCVSGVGAHECLLMLGTGYLAAGVREAIRSSMRVLISSRIGRTASTPWPAGSSRTQSS